MRNPYEFMKELEHQLKKSASTLSPRASLRVVPCLGIYYLLVVAKPDYEGGGLIHSSFFLLHLFFFLFFTYDKNCWRGFSVGLNGVSNGREA
jgi:hypothetical protein